MHATLGLKLSDRVQFSMLKRTRDTATIELGDKLTHVLRVMINAIGAIIDFSAFK